SEFVRSIQARQGLLVGCLEEIAWLQGFIDADKVLALATRYEKTNYGAYLKRVVEADR
ncbi:dTDP-glucose pyrophosphorylase, partial [Rhodoplanes tepidamans]|nr:dTDP-glucose pyrophosphorylase [Rhodoplanes tepidamans]